MNRSDIIREVGLERWVLPDRSYPSPLPDDPLTYYCYTRDGGHSLLVVVENEYRQGLSPVRFIIPAPVKMVLKAGYRLQDGLLWATLPYDRDEGLRVDDTDVEY